MTPMHLPMLSLITAECIAYVCRGHSAGTMPPLPPPWTGWRYSPYPCRNTPGMPLPATYVNIHKVSSSCMCVLMKIVIWQWIPPNLGILFWTPTSCLYTWTILVGSLWFAQAGFFIKYISLAKFFSHKEFVRCERMLVGHAWANYLQSISFCVRLFTWTLPSFSTKHSLEKIQELTSILWARFWPWPQVMGARPVFFSVWRVDASKRKSVLVATNKTGTPGQKCLSSGNHFSETFM